jgi:hypothetical protein
MRASWAAVVRTLDLPLPFATIVLGGALGVP